MTDPHAPARPASPISAATEMPDIARTVRKAFIFYGLVLLASLALDVRLLVVSSGADISTLERHIEATATFDIIVLVALLIALLINVILFLCWQHAAAKAVLERPDIPTPPITPGWHVGWWFIPIVNLIMPAVAIGKLYRASRNGPGAPWDATPFPSIVLGWWLLYLSGSGLGWYAGRVLGAAYGASDVALGASIAIAGEIVTLLALFLILRIVHKVVAFQSEWPKPPRAESD